MPASSDPLPARAVTTEAAALIVLAGLAWVARVDLSLSAYYFVKATGLFSVVMFLVLRHLRGRHPFAQFGLANQITTLRAVLVVLVAGLAGESTSPIVAETAVAAAVGATVLDGMDGWFARRRAMASAFGARFDMEIDALLIQALAVLAWQYEKAGAWVLLSGLIRYLFVAAGLVWPWLRRPLAPTRRARVICVVQIAALLVALLPAVMPPASTAIAAFGLALLGYSFLADTLRLWRGVD